MGSLPMDVNAGVDIVEVREMLKLKFIGSFNKLCVAEGESIDASSSVSGLS